MAYRFICTLWAIFKVVICKVHRRSKLGGRDLHEHDHKLVAYCATCERWAALDLERIDALVSRACKCARSVALITRAAGMFCHFKCCGSPQMNSNEAYSQFEEGLVTDEGEVTNAETAKFLRNYMAELRDFIVRCYMVLPRNVGTAE